MSKGDWRPTWSPEIEEVWSTIAVNSDPKISIQATRPAEPPLAHTRPLESDEILPKGPRPKTTRREIHVTAEGSQAATNTEFQLVTEVGSGGMGKVYRARQTALDREVALKQLNASTKVPDAVALFESEACITAVLEHPNIVPVYDMGADQGGSVFYSMKLVDGVPWDSLLYTRTLDSIAAPPGGKYDLRAHIEILLEVANALAFAHSRGIVHRDIKPANILLSGGRGHLSDLGVANYADAHFTATGSSPVGTLTYSDPRLIHGDRAGPSSDVWSLGATLHTVVTGDSVLGEIPNAHLAAAIEYVLAATVTISERCPSDVASVVERATHLDPDQRHRSAAELAVELRTLAGFYRRASQEGSPAAETVAPNGVVDVLGVLEFDDGRRFELTSDTILGREPASHERVKDGSAQAIALASEPMMSRAHLLVTVAGAAVSVTDLATNGTEIRRSGREGAELLPPGQPVRIDDGDALLVGQRTATYRLRR